MDKARGKPRSRPGKNGGKLNTGGNYGGGRPRDEFLEICRALASRDETIAVVRAILKSKSHPAFLGALKWATENGYGKPAQPVDVTSGGKRVQAFTLALGTIGDDDGDG